MIAGGFAADLLTPRAIAVNCRRLSHYPPVWLLGLFLSLLPFGQGPFRAQDTGQAISLVSDVQEANSKTGVVTARGNVIIDYPARKLRATASQAQYFSKERRIILSGNVSVTQEGGNNLRGEVITYLIDEGRFVALPQTGGRVRSVYIVTEEPRKPAQIGEKPANQNP
jgi:lipopolysaccharide export system protein LptA